MASAQAQMPPGPPPAVIVAPVRDADVARRDRYVGRVLAIQSVDIRAKVDGFLKSVNFTEGQAVKAGDLLFQIDADPFQAVLDQTRAQIARAQATLRNAEATLKRRRELSEKGTASVADFDKAVADRDAAQADVAAAQAAFRAAEVNLAFTRIHAPIAGRIGRANVTAGNLVGPSTGALARVVQLDPIRVVFSISERDIAGLRRALADKKGFDVSLVLPDGTQLQRSGMIGFTDNEADPNTGTVAVYAQFDNPDGTLLPGLTVTAVVREVPARRLPVVPVSAVQEDRQGRFVLTVGADNKAVERRIRTGIQIGQDWAVEDGLQPGEQLIVDGLQKVRPGVVVNPVAAPAQSGAQGGVKP